MNWQSPPSLVRTSIETSLSPRARATVIWVGVSLGIVVMVLAWHALAPFIWAVITAYLVRPIVAFIQRKTKLPKQVVALAFYLLLGYVLINLLITIAPLLVTQLEQVQRQLTPDVLSDVNRWIEGRRQVDSRFAAIDMSLIESRINLFGRQLADLIGTEALPLLFSTFTFVIELFIYLFASFYLVVFGPRFLISLRDAFNRGYHGEFDRLLSDVTRTLGTYLRGQRWPRRSGSVRMPTLCS